MSEHYKRGCDGFVLQWNSEHGASWWYGPDRFIPTVWSAGLDYSTAVYPTRKACEEAARSVWGRRWRDGGRHEVVTVAEAERTQRLARRRARARAKRAGSVA